MPGLARPKERLVESAYPLDFGFNDVDAFSKEDMYAVGGAGDVWHCDGQRWTQLPFPSNELLYTVCCAGDGNVYITGNMGALWVGRKDRWKRLAQAQRRRRHHQSLGASTPVRDCATAVASEVPNRR